MNVLVAVDSESGNTLEMSHEILAAMQEAGVSTIFHRINGQRPLLDLPPLQLAFIGTYTWGYGAAPAATEWFMEEHSLDCPVAAFGSGETQWGEEHFCGAVDLLRARYDSPFEGFKQENMPNDRQRSELRGWAKSVLEQVAGTPVTQELIVDG
jgi:flavodoxin I